MTNTQYKALKFLENTSYMKPMTSARIAELLWPDSSMHTSSKNTGNGACRGKAAWLCGGSYMGKLKKKGWVKDGHNFRGYFISREGKEALTKEEMQNHE